MLYKGGHLIFQKTTKLKFSRYAAHVFTIPWLLDSQGISLRGEGCLRMDYNKCI